MREFVFHVYDSLYFHDYVIIVFCTYIFLKILFNFISRMNFWGYSTVNYFSPMARYSAAGVHNFGLGATDEFKLLVREAHKRGIEVTACYRMP